MKIFHKIIEISCIRVEIFYLKIEMFYIKAEIFCINTRTVAKLAENPCKWTRHTLTKTQNLDAKFLSYKEFYRLQKED
jgi:hypothetical protein